MRKVESLQLGKGPDPQKMAQLNETLDELTMSITKAQMQRNREAKLAEKFEHVIKQLEHVNKTKMREAENGARVSKTGEEKFRTYIYGLKSFGQIVEIVASSVHVIIQAVKKVIEENKFAAKGKVMNADNSISELIGTLNAVVEQLKNNGNEINDIDSSQGMPTAPKDIPYETSENAAESPPPAPSSS